MVAVVPRDLQNDCVTQLMKGAFSHPEDIGLITQSCDLKKELLAQRPLRVGLAPEWGTCCSKTLETETMVASIGIVRSLANIAPGERTWDTVLSNITQVPLLQPQASPEHRTDMLSCRKGLSLFRPRGPDLAKRVKVWLANIIEDEDIMEAIAVDCNALADSLSSLEACMASSSSPGARREMPCIDINILRFPDSDYTCFELCRLKVDAWYQDQSFLCWPRADHGLTGAFQKHSFRPQPSIINDLSPQTLQTAVEEARELWRKAQRELDSTVPNNTEK